MKDGKINVLLLSFASILTVTGLGKVWSALGSAKILGVADPLLGLQFRSLMFVAGALELLLAGFYFFNNKRLFLYSVAWLSSMILVYRIMLEWIGWRQLCSCMGYFAQALHIPEQIADTLMIIVLAYLFTGSYGIFLYQWLRDGDRSGEQKANQ